MTPSGGRGAGVETETERRLMGDGTAKWAVDVRRGGKWEGLAEKPSADACKAAARALKDGLRGEDRTRVAFRLYDPLGRLYAVSADNHSWRMKWNQGNMLIREEIAERDAAKDVTAEDAVIVGEANT